MAFYIRWRSKKTANPEKKLIRAFHVLQKGEKPVGAGGIICMAERPFPMDELNTMIPANIL